MASLKEVKNRISSIVATQQITKAMKMVAASKLRKAQDRIIQIRPFAQKLTEIIGKISTIDSNQQDEYSTARAEEKILIVTVGSDRGLCGSFNTNIIKATMRLLQDRYLTQHRQGHVTILPIGKKTYEYFSKRSYKIEDQYYECLQSLSFDKISEITDSIIAAFKKKEYDKIEIVYNAFKNIATQILHVEQFLPIASRPTDTGGVDIDYIYQPNHKDMVAALIPKSLKVQLFKALLDSGAAENASRMTAMDKATENAGDLLKELRLTYNRTRQAMITKEILEIIGGAEALKNA